MSNILEAINKSLKHSMQDHNNVVVFGEDVGVNGGVFRATSGLQDDFGKMRVFDTPIAESMIAGLAIGMSSQGIRPVAEIQFSGFIFPALEQIVCHAARMRNRTRGRIHLPLTIRAPYGGGIHAPEHHSESVEALFAHIPGLRVVVPSTPSGAYHLLRQSILCNDPVIFLEPKRIYRLTDEEIKNVDDNDVFLNKAHIEKEGNDITIVSWGAMMNDVRSVVDSIEGVSVELIDLVSINPIDKDTILNSVKKTGKCVIVQESARACSVGSEISSIISENALTEIYAPVKVVSGYDVTMPYFALEKKYIPSFSKIKNGIIETYEYDL